jgi:hypothetical protein
MDSPPAIAAANAPEKQSPAPTVSTAVTFGAGNQRAPATLRQQTPRAPHVASTCFTPSACSRPVAASTSCFRFVGKPVNADNSLSLGVRKAACRSSPIGACWAGAGFNSTGMRCRFASSIARRTVASGISSCTTRQRAWRIAGSAASRCLGNSSSFDPRATAIRFSPCASTMMRATPLGAHRLRRM